MVTLSVSQRNNHEFNLDFLPCPVYLYFVETICTIVGIEMNGVRCFAVKPIFG